MKKMDADYIYLKDMVEDSYYPPFLVEKVKELILELVAFLEPEEKTEEEIQKKCDEITQAINELQEEFDENDSEIETVARESIFATVKDIFEHFNISIDPEEAIRERDW